HDHPRRARARHRGDRGRSGDAHRGPARRRRRHPERSVRALPAARDRDRPHRRGRAPEHRHPRPLLPAAARRGHASPPDPRGARGGRGGGGGGLAGVLGGLPGAHPAAETAAHGVVAGWFRPPLVLTGLAVVGYLVAQIGPAAIWSSFVTLGWRLPIVLTF